MTNTKNNTATTAEKTLTMIDSLLRSNLDTEAKMELASALAQSGIRAVRRVVSTEPEPERESVAPASSLRTVSVPAPPRTMSPPAPRTRAPRRASKARTVLAPSKPTGRKQRDFDRRYSQTEERREAVGKYLDKYLVCKKLDIHKWLEQCGCGTSKGNVLNLLEGMWHDGILKMHKVTGSGRGRAMYVFARHEEDFKILEALNIHPYDKNWPQVLLGLPKRHDGTPSA